MAAIAWLPIGLCAALLARASGLQSAANVVALAVAIGIAGPVWLGRLTESFTQAVLLTGFCALMVAGAAWRLRRVEPIANTVQKPTDGDRRGIPRGLWGPIALMGTGVIWTALANGFWVESTLHYPFTAAIARGVLPLVHPLFPEAPLRHPFGYDVLAAHVLSSTGLPLDAALDVATVASFILLLLACRQLGRELAGRWGAGLMMLVVPLASGTLALLLFDDMGPLQLNWDALPARWRSPAPPMVISAFFRHPFGLGIGLAIVTLSAFSAAIRDDRGHRGRLAVGAFLLGVLALVHISLFAVMSVALAAALAVHGIAQRRFRALAEAVAALASAIAIAYSLGGFFAGGLPSGPILQWGTSVFAGDPLSVVGQHAVLFGLPLLLLPLTVYDAARSRDPTKVAMVLAALIGFVTPNIAVYASGAWETIELVSIAMVFASALLVPRLARWARGGPTAGFIALLVTAFMTASAWLWLARTSVLNGRTGVPKLRPPASSQAAQQFARALDPLIPARDRIMTFDVDIGLYGGLLIPGFDWRRYGSGLPVNREEAERSTRIKAQAMRTLDPRALNELGVRWVIFRQRDLVHLRREGLMRIADPSFVRLALEYGTGQGRRRVFRLVPNKAPHQGR